MKKIIKLSLFMICLVILSYEYLVDMIRSNDFDTIILCNGDVLESPQDISKGYYDIEVLEGTVSVGLISLEKGEVYHNYHVTKGTKLFIDDGQGKIKISQAKKNKFVDECFEIREVGNYIIGEDIQEGKYRITLKSKHFINESVTCYLKDENENGIDQFTFHKSCEQVVMNFRKGEKVFVERRTEINQDKSPVFLEFEQISQ